MFRYLAVVLAALVLGVQGAQTQYQMILENDVTVDSKTYEFDVYIRSTTGVINLTSYQFFLTYNAAIANGGTLSFTYIGGTSASGLTPLMTAIYPDGVSNLGSGSTAGSDAIDAAGKRLGRFRLKNTVDFAQVPANLAWDFGGFLKTIVNINSVNVTTSDSHVSLLGNAPLPITLSSFTVQHAPDASGVKLSWMTISEVNNYGFYVQRRAGDENVFTDIPNSFVPGHGTTLEAQQYVYVDAEVSAGKWYYRLKQVDLDGATHFSDEVTVDLLTGVEERLVPTTVALLQNYPNPFNPSTTIEYALPSQANVRLEVCNLLGERVAMLADGVRGAGWHAERFDASGLASGVYLYRLHVRGMDSPEQDARGGAGSLVEVRKLVLLR